MFHNIKVPGKFKDVSSYDAHVTRTANNILDRFLTETLKAKKLRASIAGSVSLRNLGNSTQTTSGKRAVLNSFRKNLISRRPFVKFSTKNTHSSSVTEGLGILDLDAGHFVISIFSPDIAITPELNRLRTSIIEDDDWCNLYEPLKGLYRYIRMINNSCIKHKVPASFEVKTKFAKSANSSSPESPDINFSTDCVVRIQVKIYVRLGRWEPIISSGERLKLRSIGRESEIDLKSIHLRKTLYPNDWYCGDKHKYAFIHLHSRDNIPPNSGAQIDGFSSEILDEDIPYLIYERAVLFTDQFEKVLDTLTRIFTYEHRAFDIKSEQTDMHN